MSGFGLARRWQEAIAKLPGVPCPVCGQMVTIEDAPRRAHVTDCDRNAQAQPERSTSLQAVPAGNAR